ncbi:hypothetical protein [Reticulibacter mediterranei]|uniref:hypothetical protein n=1 Tax=Reticulibacter mediterranei TaxID=2778369 RepID=UPI001C68F58A|nr:hypothetical protein [Reticulibacter mediterranei]
MTANMGEAMAGPRPASQGRGDRKQARTSHRLSHIRVALAAPFIDGINERKSAN